MPSPVRIAVVLVLDAVALLVLAGLLDRFEISTVWAALGMSGVMGLPERARVARAGARG